MASKVAEAKTGPVVPKPEVHKGVTMRPPRHILPQQPTVYGQIIGVTPHGRAIVEAYPTEMLPRYVVTLPHRAEGEHEHQGWWEATYP